MVPRAPASLVLSCSTLARKSAFVGKQIGDCVGRIPSVEFPPVDRSMFPDRIFLEKIQRRIVFVSFTIEFPILITRRISESIYILVGRKQILLSLFLSLFLPLPALAHFFP